MNPYDPMDDGERRAWHLELWIKAMHEAFADESDWWHERSTRPCPVLEPLRDRQRPSSPRR